jgi:hypothetical protein
VRQIARRYFGARGAFAYAAFDHINATYFDGALPLPLIQWALTPHGRCLGQTHVVDRPPVITLHPSLLGGTESVTPWGISPAHLGPTFAFDVLIHECVHVAVCYLLGGRAGRSSHDNPLWAAECSRIAPLLGIPHFVAGRARGGTSLGAAGAPYRLVYAFPYALRQQLDGGVFYCAGVLPFAHRLSRPASEEQYP